MHVNFPLGGSAQIVGIKQGDSIKKVSGYFTALYALTNYRYPSKIPNGLRIKKKNSFQSHFLFL